MKKRKWLALLLALALLTGCGSAGSDVPPEDTPRDTGDIISDAVEATQNSQVTSFGLGLPGPIRAESVPVYGPGEPDDLLSFV